MTENQVGCIFLAMFAALWIFIIHKSDEELNSPAAIARREACAKTRTEVVTQAGGITLFRYMKNCDDPHPVYFSGAGTSTTHSERSGKSTHTVQDITPNANGTP